MSLIHLMNLILHIGAGTIALAIGFYVLSAQKGNAKHRYWGRLFGVFALLVCLSAAVGTLFFRFIPVFATLTVLVSYQLMSGWRSVYTKDKGPALIDGALTLAAIILAAIATQKIFSNPGSGNVVVYSSLGAIAFITLYDTVRWLFPRSWFFHIWRYDHSFKLISSVFAMLSALVGNVIRVGQPWSQITPSVLGLICIVYFFHQLYKKGPRSDVSHGA